MDNAVYLISFKDNLQRGEQIVIATHDSIILKQVQAQYPGRVKGYLVQISDSLTEVEAEIEKHIHSSASTSESEQAPKNSSTH